MAESKTSKAASRVIDVYIKLTSGRTISMDMKPGDKVQQIYNQVAKEESVPENRILIKYTGKILNKTYTVGYLGVCAETILKAEIQEIKIYNVYVKLETGRTISLEIENIATIKQIKDMISLEEGIAPNRQILKFGGQTLSKLTERVLDVGITDEATLHLIESSSLKAKQERKSSAKKVGDAGSSSDYDRDSHSETDQNEPTNMEEHDKEAVMNTFDAAGRNVEVVFSFDTTGSMYACLDKVRTKLQETVERLIRNIPTIRIGIIAHGDYCDYDEYVLRMIDLTSNVEELVKFVNGVPATGGGDSPECYEWVLHKAASMDWSENSAKALLVIGDCIPHPPCYTTQNINWHVELDLLKAIGIKVYGVKALSDSSSLLFYQELADRTGGAFISFQNFDIIADMFLAVCYREASAEQFDAFCEEVGQDKDAEQGVDSKVKDIQNVLSQLDEQKNKTADEKSNRYVAEAWWDPQLDTSKPYYSYNAEADRWSPVENVCTHRSVFSRRSVHGSPTKTTKSKKTRRSRSFLGRVSLKSRAEDKSTTSNKKSCVIM